MKTPKINIDTKDAIIYGSVAIGVLLLAKRLGLFTKKDSAILKKEQEKDLEEEIRKEERKDEASYSETQYNDFADKIYNALFCPIFICADGTDQKAIYSVIRQLKNNLDWLKLKEAFGNRRIEYTTRSSGLVQNLNADLSSSQLKEINNILSQQGISYRV